MALQVELAKRIRNKEGIKGVVEVSKRIKAVVMKALGGKTHKELGMKYEDALKKALAEYKA